MRYMIIAGVVFAASVVSVRAQDTQPSELPDYCDVLEDLGDPTAVAECRRQAAATESWISTLTNASPGDIAAGAMKSASDALEAATSLLGNAAMKRGRRIKNAASSVGNGAADVVNGVVATARGRGLGDDGVLNANNGVCNDERFVPNEHGVMVVIDGMVEEDRTDCQSLLRQGRIRWRGDPRPKKSPIEYGDDSGSDPYDGQCDDGRFMGPVGLMGADPRQYRKDASDCRLLYGRGDILLRPLPKDF